MEQGLDFLPEPTWPSGFWPGDLTRPSHWALWNKYSTTAW